MTHHSEEVMTSELDDSENGSISTVSELSDASGKEVSEVRPSVSCCVKDSSDVHVGTRNQYNAPVTVQKYKVTVRNEIPGFNFVPNFSVTQPSPVLRLLPAETHPGSTETTKPVEDPNYHIFNLNVNEDLQQEAPCMSVRGLLPKCGKVNTGIYVGTVIAVLVISVTVAVYYLGAEASTLSEENSLNFTVQTSCGNDSVDVGTEYVFWKVKVNTTFKPEFQWYGPQGEVLLQGNSRKYLIYGSSERSESDLKLFNIDLSDAGQYRLHVFSKARPEVKTLINVSLTIKIRNPPDMVPNLAEDELKTGDNITVECTALNPITWSYPRQERDPTTDGESRVHITEVRRLQYYVSTLHVSGADYLDTGFYGCTVNESSSFFYPITTTRTYIYVRDDEHLLVGKKDSIVFLNVNAFQPVVIPCRTTARYINTSLWHTFVPKNNRNNINNNNINNNVNINSNNITNNRNININNNINNNNNNVNINSNISNNNANINSNNITNNKINRNNNNNINNNRSFIVTSYDRKVGFTLEQVNQNIALTCSATGGNTTEDILYVLSVYKLPQKHTLGDRVRT
jgi:hypothetical protein